MRQCRWLEFVKDYDCEILYHPGKVNRVTDALSCKTTELSHMSLDRFPTPLQKDIHSLELVLITGKLATLQIQPSIFDKMATTQRQDSTLNEYWKEDEERKETEFKVSDKGILTFQGRFVFQKMKILGVKFFLKLIIHLIRYIQEQLRCVKT